MVEQARGRNQGPVVPAQSGDMEVAYPNGVAALDKQSRPFGSTVDGAKTRLPSTKNKDTANGLPRRNNRSGEIHIDNGFDPNTNTVELRPTDSDGDKWGEIESEEIAALYLREIGQYKLLTADQEVSLSKEREAGVAATEKLNDGIIDDIERANLEEAVKVGDAARKRLIDCNLRLPANVAKKYMGRGLPFLDLVQEGNIGLQRGVDKYDWRRGFRLSTYVYWWIMQGISRASSEQGRTIRLPVHIIEQLTKIYKVFNELHGELGREPSILEWSDKVDLAPENLRKLLEDSMKPTSIETPIGNGEEVDVTIGELIADPTAEEFLNIEVSRNFLKGHVGNLLGLLPEDEREIICRYYGINCPQETFYEISLTLKVGAKRLQQIKEEAIKKLRILAAKQRLQEFLE